VTPLLAEIGTVVASIISAVVAFAAAIVLVKVFDRLRLKDAENQAKEIVGRAEREATTKLKEAELETKEKALIQKA
jgi:hypothetical protein